MAKRPRRKGMRTAYLVSYSAAYINTGRTPNSIHMEEWRQRQQDACSDPFHVGPGTFQLKQETTWSGVRFAGFEKVSKVCIIAGKRTRRWHCFTGPYHFFFEEDLLLKTEQRSIVYPSKTIAFAALDRGAIVWVAKASSPS